MEQNDTQELQQEPLSSPDNTPIVTAAPPQYPAPTISSQAGSGTCGTCGQNQGSQGNGRPNFVYAIGTIEPRFPMSCIEKECAQAISRLKGTDRLTDQQVFQKVISDPNNRYLARQMCWVFKVEGLDTYILQLRDPMDLDRLIDTVRATPNKNDLDVVIGRRGPIAPPEMCNGLMLPIVVFEQIHSFPITELLDELGKSMPTTQTISGQKKPKKLTAQELKDSAHELFQRIVQMADNAGGTDEHRAMNYLAVRYDSIYAMCAEEFGRNCSLTDVQVRPSRLSGARKVADAVFSFTDREKGVTNKWFVRVDVTEEFPFLVTPLSPYYVYDQHQ